MLRCPFCGSEETDRIDLDGRRFLVFGCMFTPEVDPHLDDPALAAFLAARFAAATAPAYFRRMCDRMHLFVTAGAGGRALGAPAEGRPPASADEAERS